MEALRAELRAGAQREAALQQQLAQVRVGRCFAVRADGQRDGGGAGPTPDRGFVFANPPSHPKPNAVDPL